MKKIAVVGAGIIGSCTAWSLLKRGYQVDLYDKDTPMAHTSQSSSKLLHGGLRYLETGQFKLVHKALQARQFWLQQSTTFMPPVRIAVSHLQMKVVLNGKLLLVQKLYDVLAKKAAASLK